MKWSWRVLSIRGIDIKIHVTFIFALIWGAFMWGGGEPAGLAYGALLTAVLFVVVLLHELGHSIAAQHYGIKVHDIILLPIGGVARLERMPEKPSQELVVALAGPAVNLGFVLLLSPVLLLAMGAESWRYSLFALPSLTEPGWANFVAFLFGVNLSLLLFNLLPAFPMDGGRALRALLALKLRYGRATTVAVMVGRLFALLFGVTGFFTGNLMLAFVGVFVFFGASAEHQEVSRRETLRGLRVSEVIDNQAPVMPGSLPAFAAFDRLTRSPYRAIAVLDDNGGLVGVVTREAMQAKWTAGLRGTVAAFAEPSRLAVECESPLEAAHERMTESQTAVAAVFCGNRFQGLLDLETIGRVVALRRRNWLDRQAVDAQA